MNNKQSEFGATLLELVEAIDDICLGSITEVVADGAVHALIASWNDHNEDKIDEIEELGKWEEFKLTGEAGSVYGQLQTSMEG